MKTLYSFTSIAVVLSLALATGACSGSGEQQSGEQEQQQTMTADTSQMAADSTVQKINLNTGTKEEFMSIPGVVESMVGEFEEYSPYVSISQFRKEIGKYVDEETIAGYEQYVYVPIDRNESDAATLMQIPGLDNSEAQALIDGRPYESNQAFLDALAQYVSENQLAKAKRYLSSE